MPDRRSLAEKLLALANDAGATPAERASARRKYDELKARPTPAQTARADSVLGGNATWQGRPTPQAMTFADFFAMYGDEVVINGTRTANGGIVWEFELKR